MRQKLLVPVLGESITEATVGKWLKKKGEQIKVDEPIVELETDKVSLEVPSPINGILSEIKSNDGETVEVGAELGIISEANDASKQQNKNNDTNSNNIINLEIEKKNEINAINKKKNEEDPLILNKEKEKPLILLNEVKNNLNKNTILSPAVRKIVSERKIDIENIKGTGRDGRVLKSDLINLMGTSPKPNQRKINFGEEERIKMTKLRQTIAKRLKQAQENAALLTTFNEVDMTNIIAMRKENQEDFKSRFDIKLGFMSFFVKACVVGLKLFPVINAEIEGEEIIYKNYYNISIAVGTDKGLVVPVIKNADEMSFAEIESSIKSLSEKANLGKLSIEDLQGGTFTITNGGVYGSMLSTPILNPPQSGVLGMHNIIERPHIVEGEIKIRPIMYLALSYDHRIVDGKESVSFLKTVKENLEDPRRLFLDI